MLIWKIVFWVTTALILFAVASLPLADILPTTEDMLALPIQILGQLCIYGYAYQKAIGSQNMATMVFLLNVALGLYSLINAAPLLLQSSEPWDVIATVLAIGLVAALLIPLYRYAFKSGHLWRQVI